MKTIPLDNGKLVVVDDEDYNSLSQFKWRYHKEGYAVRNEGRKQILMHREILNLKRGELCDHENRNGLDNRRFNLRQCSNAENMRNRGANKNNKLGVKGIRWQEDVSKYRAEIHFNGKTIYLGIYSSLPDAVSARNIAELKLFGPFACPTSHVIAQKEAGHD